MHFLAPYPNNNHQKPYTDLDQNLTVTLPHNQAITLKRPFEERSVNMSPLTQNVLTLMVKCFLVLTMEHVQEHTLCKKSTMLSLHKTCLWFGEPRLSFLERFV